MQRRYEISCKSQWQSQQRTLCQDVGSLSIDGGVSGARKLSGDGDGSGVGREDGDGGFSRVDGEGVRKECVPDGDRVADGVGCVGGVGGDGKRCAGEGESCNNPSFPSSLSSSASHCPFAAFLVRLAILGEAVGDSDSDGASL
jgi:hypothetical protein